MPTLYQMIRFIIRRLIVTVFLLIVVSMITFAIFFLIPRLAGQNSYQLASQYVGRNPTPAAIHAIEQKLGFNDLPQILGVVMLTAFFVVIANLIVDILYAVVDPRVRY